MKEGGRGRERKEERKEGREKRREKAGEHERREDVAGRMGDGSEREEKRGGRHCFPEWAAKERRRVRGTVCL